MYWDDPVLILAVVCFICVGAHLIKAILWTKYEIIFKTEGFQRNFEPLGNPLSLPGWSGLVDL